MSDARLLLHEQEEITAGAAVAGMLLTGLGGAKRPWSFPPPCLTNIPRALLCRQGVRAELCNRFQLGRTRDESDA